MTAGAPRGRAGAGGPGAVDARRWEEGDEFEEEEEEGARAGAGAGAEEGGGWAAETPEQKRLRLAQAYLDRLAREEGAGRGGEGAGDDADGQIGVTGGEAEEAEEAVARRLEREALEAAGHIARQLRPRLRLPPAGPGRCLAKAHRGPLTAVALAGSDAHAFTVSKEGRLVRWDVSSLQQSALGPAPAPGPPRRALDALEPPPVDPMRVGGAPAVARKRRDLLAVAVSGDERLVAAGGGDCCVHVWDVRTGAHVKALTGHKGAITGLAFREGTQELFSASADRSVKMWDLASMAYVDTLFGHQGAVTAVDCGRKQRAVTVGADRTGRMWKVQDETHLIFKGFRAPGDCCRLISPAEFVTGSQDGSLGLWNHLKKKALFTVPRAHPAAPERLAALGPCAEWVSAVASPRGGDLLATGAGAGCVKLWGVAEGRKGHELEELAELEAPGFVNGLAFANSGRFLLGALGQEPRLGRWARDPAARNALLVHSLEFDD